jgi:hypothetical protein
VGLYTAEVVEAIKNGYTFLPGAGPTSLAFTIE